MDITASLYGLALKDVTQLYKEYIDGHMRLCPHMTSEEYAVYAKRTVSRELKWACSRKRAELNSAIKAKECIEIPIIRKELRMAVARSKAYKELITGWI